MMNCDEYFFSYYIYIFSSLSLTTVAAMETAEIEKATKVNEWKQISDNR